MVETGTLPGTVDVPTTTMEVGEPLGSVDV